MTIILTSGNNGNKQIFIMTVMAGNFLQCPGPDFAGDRALSCEVNPYTIQAFVNNRFSIVTIAISRR